MINRSHSKTSPGASLEQSNPLLDRTAVIPFDSFEAHHIEPAIEKLLASSNAELEAIKAVKGVRTFDNTMRALDDLALQLNFAINIIGHLESVATYPAWRDAYNKVLPKVAEFSSQIVLDPDLWRAIQDFSLTEEAKSLDGERKRFLDKTLASFLRYGAELSPEHKETLRAVHEEIAEVTSRFAQNAVDATNAFEYTTDSEDDLSGLPESARQMGSSSAASKNLPGWRFTLQTPSYLAIMTYADKRDLREMFYRANTTLCSGGDFDNVELVYRILELRKQAASILGFRDFSELILADRMARNGECAAAFLEKLQTQVAPYAQEENRALFAFVKDELGVDPATLQPWDILYYAEKMRRAQYEFDDEILRLYFPLPAVMRGLFEIAEKTFGITIEENANLPKWCPEVTTYVVRETMTQEVLGHFYCDLFPRENKCSGAWMDGFITHIVDGKDELPHVGVIVANLTTPQGGKPSLLTHNEVTTLFHEFGHLMHLLCSSTEFRSLSMDGVAWDFIELPSHLLENWCWDKEALKLIAAHVDTQESLPDTLFQKMLSARNFRSGAYLMRQLGCAMLDLELHRSYERDRDGDVLEYSRAIMQQYLPLPVPQDYAMVATYTHLFDSPVGYGAGYYSYLWSQVLDADVFSKFRHEGIMNLTTGLEFRDKVMSRGDTKDPEDLIRDFLGRDPEFRALLERAGLV